MNSDMVLMYVVFGVLVALLLAAGAGAMYLVSRVVNGGPVFRRGSKKR